jgi:hypothetical protein
MSCFWKLKNVGKKVGYTLYMRSVHILQNEPIESVCFVESECNKEWSHFRMWTFFLFKILHEGWLHFKGGSTVIYLSHSLSKMRTMLFREFHTVRKDFWKAQNTNLNIMTFDKNDKAVKSPHYQCYIYFIFFT